jgi:hypothetical protein
MHNLYVSVWLQKDEVVIKYEGKASQLTIPLILYEERPQFS